MNPIALIVPVFFLLLTIRVLAFVVTGYWDIVVATVESVQVWHPIQIVVNLVSLLLGAVIAGVVGAFAWWLLTVICAIGA